MTPSLSARLPRPTGRPRVPNAGPAPVLALWPAAALAPGRVAAHVWHGQTRLGERFHLRCERSAAVTAVASARQECAQLLCLLHFSNRCMHNLRIGQRQVGNARGRVGGRQEEGQGQAEEPQPEATRRSGRHVMGVDWRKPLPEATSGTTPGDDLRGAATTAESRPTILHQLLRVQPTSRPL